MVFSTTSQLMIIPATSAVTASNLSGIFYGKCPITLSSQLIFPLGLAYQVLYCILSWYRYVVGRISNRSGRHTRAESIFRGAISAVAFLSMWMDLAIFNETRTESHRFVGQSYLEDRWTYGQILTIMTWFSVSVEFLRLWMCKSQPTPLRHFCEIFGHGLGEPTHIHIANLHFQGILSTTI